MSSRKPLDDLLCKLYPRIADLRRFLSRGQQGAELEQHFSDEGVGIRRLAEEAAAELERRGLVQDAVLRAAAEFPYRRAEIEQVMQALGIAGTARTAWAAGPGARSDDEGAPRAALEPVRWLHLSDLHIGCRGESAWWHVLDQFWRSVDQHLKLVGAVDIVLLTGDLTFKADRGEFDELTKFLEALLARLPKTAGGLAPLVVAVPGNHDVKRPSGREALLYRVLRDFEKGRDDPDVAGLLDDLWGSSDASFLRPLFANYMAWFDGFVRPQASRPGVRLHTSFFPGDLFVSLDPPGRFPLAIVGLNSAWLQYQGGDFEGKLALPVEQFHAALPHGKDESPLGALAGVHRALLLMHHPRSWLSKAQQRIFDGGIHAGEHFVACLHGHMHEADGVNSSRAGGVARCHYQAPSLFGVEHYGSSRESRAIGYTWAALRDDGEIRAWPLKLRRKGDGAEVFDRDEFFHWDTAEGNVLLRPADGRRYGRAQAPGDGPASDEDARRGEGRGGPRVVVGEPAALPAYRRWLAAQRPAIHLIGLGGGNLTLSLDAVYVPLRAMPFSGDEVVAPWRAQVETTGDGSGPSDFDVEQLFATVKTRHSVLLGEPGAGKTTALLKLFHTCAREPGGRLGLSPGTVPVLLQLRRFTTERRTQPLVRWLQDELTADPAGGLPPDLGAALWAHGRLLVLADGLDELFQKEQREALGEHLSFALAAEAGEHVRAVVSCRFAGYRGEFGRDPQFTTLALRPLRPQHVRALVQQWFAEAARRTGGALAAAQVTSKSLLDELEGPAYANQRLRVMVSTPLLLTLLCVIVHEGRPLPRSRTEYYERCLEVLLKRWGQENGRREPPLDLERAKAVLRPLAYTLHVEGAHEAQVRGSLARQVNAQIRRRGLAAVDGFAVVDWLERDTGVLQELRRGYLGFAHLGLQEYLAAAHIVAEGREHVEALANRIDDPWWHEVTRLTAAQRGAFVPLMRSLLRRPLDQGELISDLLEDSCEAEPSPLLERLEELRSPAEIATMLRLLRRFASDAAVAAAAEARRDHAHAEVRALARRLLEVRTTGAGPDDRDIVLVFAEDDRAAAEAFTRRIRNEGLRVYEHDSRLLDAIALNRCLDEAARAAPCAVVLHRRTDPAVRGCLDYLADVGVALACVPLPGAVPPAWPAEYGHVRVFDLAEGIDSLGQWHAELRKRDVQGVIAGQVFTDIWAGIRFLPVPGQRFEMGMRGVAEPVHAVELRPYWLAETPVTNAQYATFLSANLGQSEPDYWRERRFSGGEQPVVGVSWAEATAFCAWLSRCPGLADVVEVRLPTEAQWEFAARGKEGRVFPWGGDLPDRSRAVYGRQEGTARVGSCPAGKGPFGHLDLAGNVWELCRDGWRPDAYRYRTEGTVEPEEPATLDGKVVRGDCWFGDGSWLAAAMRRGTPARRRDAFVGFRPAAVLLGVEKG